METINNVSTAIKSTIWGEGTNGSTATGSTATNSEVHKSMIDDSVTETEYDERTKPKPDANGAYKPGQGDSDKGPEGPNSTGGQPQGANLTNEQGTNKNPLSSSNEPNTGFGGGDAQPSVTADPTSEQRDTQKHQGDDNSSDEPKTSPTSSGQSSKSATRSGGSSPIGGMKLPESDNKSKGEGTGILYEKSTGFYADGGDFDATRPGAAREADRLMDEMGTKHGENNPDAKSGEPLKERKWFGVDHSGLGGHGSHTNKRPSVSKSSEDGHTEKKGLGQKIKEKLHHSSSD